jgi:pimeloyl-ACP methyl ester carboxylesterase
MVQKKTIVLVHGFGEDSRIFEDQIKVLSQEFEVFAPDLPGSGTLSDYNWRPGTDTIDWLAEWVHIQLINRQIKSCIMLGHSMGGYITLAFAEKFPNKLAAFGLVHSTAFADPEAKKETRQKAIRFMKEKGAHTFLKTSIPGLFGSTFTKEYPEKITALVQQAQAFTVETLSCYYRAMILRPDRSEVLKNASTPVLLVAGAEDTAVPLADLLSQASYPAECHFHILKQSGHMGMLEESENLSKILLNFSAGI